MGNLESYFRSRRLRETVLTTLRRVGRRRENVLVVGQPGAGKSTFVSTSRYCVLGTTGGEVASAGTMVNSSSYTVHLRTYPLITAEMDHELSLTTPMVFDMPGFPNQDNDTIRTVLLGVLEGRVPDGQDLVFVNPIQEDILNQYGVRENNIIDRVVLVHSCRTPECDNLARVVLEICRRKAVTVFSLVTHMDQEQLINERIPDNLEEAVGTTGTPRSGRAELYHTMQDGVYETNYTTERYILQLWNAILNQNYPIHSNFALQN